MTWAGQWAGGTQAYSGYNGCYGVVVIAPIVAAAIIAGIASLGAGGIVAATAAADRRRGLDALRESYTKHVAKYKDHVAKGHEKRAAKELDKIREIMSAIEGAEMLILSEAGVPGAVAAPAPQYPLAVQGAPGPAVPLPMDYTPWIVGGGLLAAGLVGLALWRSR